MLLEIEVFSRVWSARRLKGDDTLIKIHLDEAEGHLGRLIEEAASGQEVQITGHSGFTVRLMPLIPEPPRGAEPYQSPLSSLPIGSALDRFIGTWTPEDEAELLRAVEVFERVDEAFWK